VDADGLTFACAMTVEERIARRLGQTALVGLGAANGVPAGRLVSFGIAGALSGDVPVGTVDKFQGQEADVVFYSMASSSGDDIPRSLEFLFSRNRLDVAISRARCLAFLVCSPRLLEVDARTVEHMRLANALCRFVEIAEEENR